LLVAFKGGSGVFALGRNDVLVVPDDEVSIFRQAEVFRRREERLVKTRAEGGTEERRRGGWPRFDSSFSSKE
jgi:hypothetical protein